MWNRQRPAMDVAALWAAEEATTLEERRAKRSARYPATPVSALVPWTVHAARLPKYQAIHSYVPPVVERPPASVFHLKSTSGHNVYYVTRLTPNVAQQDAENAATMKKFHDSLPKEEGSPFTPNAMINRKICLWRGNITNIETDAIVNAANTSLLGGGGVDGAIHNAAGDSLYDECLTLGGGQTGFTKITRGHRLPARFVLHTVGPVGEQPAALTSCYSTCLGFIDGSEPMPYPAAPIRSVTFCGVSTGIYGYPLVAASKVALETTRKWLEKHHDKVDMIVFCTFLEKEWDCYETLLPYYFPPTPDAQFHDEWIADHQPRAAPSSSTDEDTSEEDSE